MGTFNFFRKIKVKSEYTNAKLNGEGGKDFHSYTVQILRQESKFMEGTNIAARKDSINKFYHFHFP